LHRLSKGKLESQDSSFNHDIDSAFLAWQTGNRLACIGQSKVDESVKLPDTLRPMDDEYPGKVISSG